MWLDAVILGILALFVGLGALRGALAAGLALLSLFVAYGAAVLAAPRLGPPLGAALGTAPWIGMALAGSLAFLLAYLAMGLVSLLLRRAERRRLEGSRSPRDRFLGGIFGGARGALVALLLSYLALWVDALGATGTLASAPRVEGSAAAIVTEAVVEAGMHATLADTGPGGRMMARVAARPGRTLGELTALLEHPKFRRLQTDERFWTLVEHGNPDAALNQLSFLELSYDSDLRRQLGALGLIPEDAVADPAAFRAGARDVLVEVGQRIRGVREDPALQELMEDPEIVAALQAGDHLSVARHPGFQAVVGRAMQGPP